MKCWRILLSLALTVTALGAWLWPGDKGLSHPAITLTAAVAVLAWAWGSAELLWSTAAARWVWGFAWLQLANHVFAAFHWGHQWSHQAALEHTAQTAGVAEGLYVNYVVLVIWLVDVVERLGFKAQRPAWMEWCWHGFLGFIFFNATITYANWQFRVLGLTVGTLLLIVWRWPITRTVRAAAG